MASKSTISNGLVVFAKDIERVAAFYQQTLDLHVSEAKKSHQVLNGDDLEIVIHSIPAKIAANITISQPPEARSMTAFKPAFRVTDLEAVKAAATATGGTLKPIEDAWQIRGALVVDGCDPEGNVVQFKQQ